MSHALGSLTCAGAFLCLNYSADERGLTVVNVTIDDNEVRRMLAKLESGDAFKAGLRSMAGYLRGKASVYPPTEGNRPPQPFVSEKQRR